MSGTFKIENQPRTLLLGCPFHDEYDAVARIRTGEFKLHDLGVTLELFKSNRGNESYTTFTMFDVSHVMPSVSLSTPTDPVLQVQAAMELKIDDDYMDAFLDEYVDLPCNFKGKVIDVRYFLIENQPRTLLLGCPFHDEYDAVARIRTGKFKLHDLGVTLELFKSNRVNESYTTFAMFDVSHVMPPVSLSTPTDPVLQVQAAMELKIGDDYMDTFLNEYVADSNINSSFLREDYPM